VAEEVACDYPNDALTNPSRKRGFPMCHALHPSILVVACLILTAGCKVDTHEQVMMRSDQARPDSIRKTQYRGQYRLYAVGKGAPTTQSSMPIFARALGKGEQIGFRVDVQHRLHAVAADQWIALDATVDSDYSSPAGFTWTMQPDPGQIDPGKTALLIVGVGVATAGIGAIVGAAVAGPAIALAAL
jgi:hypothetical protein